MKAMRWNAGLAWVLLLVPGVASSQTWDAGPLGEDLGSLAIHLGTVVPTVTFSDGSSHDSGLTLGASASWWPFRHLGFRASGFRSQTDGVEGDQFSAVALQNPTVYIYGVELAARYPMGGGAIAWAPYLAGGPSGKTYRWSIDVPKASSTSWGWNVAGGVDIRPRDQFGVLVEARNHRSQYLWHGLGEGSTVHRDTGRTMKDTTGPSVSDWVVTVGFSVNR